MRFAQSAGPDLRVKMKTSVEAHVETHVESTFLIWTTTFWFLTSNRSPTWFFFLILDANLWSQNRLFYLKQFGFLLVPFWGTFGALGGNFWHLGDQFWTFFGPWVALWAHFRGSRTSLNTKSAPRAAQEAPAPKFPHPFGDIFGFVFCIFADFCWFFSSFFRYQFSTPFLKTPGLKKVTFGEVRNHSFWWELYTFETFFIFHQIAWRIDFDTIWGQFFGSCWTHFL